MKKNLFILTLSILPFTLMAQKPLKGPLDGKIYSVEITKEGKKKPINPSDDLKFAAGKFKSTCEDFNDFKTGIYKIASIDSSNASSKVYSWSAELINESKETMTWSGTITGEEIEGTAELANTKGVTKYSYTFSGKLKGKPGKK